MLVEHARKKQENWCTMFATRKQLKIVNRELQNTRLIVDRLRRDLDRAQLQLRNMHGWWDDFTKTRELPDSETRVFVRPAYVTNGSSAVALAEAAVVEAEAVPPSGVRRALPRGE